MNTVSGAQRAIADDQPAIDSQRLWRHTQAFARYPKLSGSADELTAFRYIEEELARLGYSTRLLSHLAYVSWPGQADLRFLDESFPCITHAMASHRPDGLIAPVTDLTEIAQGDWHRHQIAGRIVCSRGLASPAAVRRLEQLGAVGALFVNGLYTHEMIVSTVWGNPDLRTASELPKIPVVSVSSTTWNTLRAAIDRNPESSLTLTTNVDTRWRQLPLLEARLEVDEGGDFVLFSGHVDVWHLGAMDNGAANATMLEVAAQIAQRKAYMRRGLRLAFWSGHSHGRYAGSAWYADEHFEELRSRCVLHVNIDSVGGVGADDLSNAPAMAEVRSLAAKVIRLVSDRPYVGARSERAGDQSFYGLGVPSLFMGLSEQSSGTADPKSAGVQAILNQGRSGGFGWWWHTTEDTLDKLDPIRLARDAKVYTSAIVTACMEPILPFRYSATVEEMTGAIHHYLDLAEGLADGSKTLARLNELHSVTKTLEDAIDRGQILPEVANQALKALGRALVPINYVAGSHYEHDRALGQGPVPSLQFCETIPQLAKEDLHKAAVTLRRRLNRVDAGLADALRAVQEALRTTSPTA